MLEQGVGRRAWRAKYPGEDWLTLKRRQLPNGDRILLTKEFKTTRAAVLTFFDKDFDLHWVVHCDGELTVALAMYELLEKEAEAHPLPSDYSGLPNFARF
jgi:hypothetical protein